MAEKEGEATGIWLIVVLVIVAAALLLKDEFRKPKPHAPAAAVTAQAPAAAPIAAASNPATTPDANDSIQPPDPRVVFESDEFADVAPKIPANVIPKGPPPKVSGKPLDLMKYTLRALILAQEAYAAETNFMTYADNVGKLKEMPRYPGVRVMISNASANGYLAVATHDNLPGAKCALSVGPAPMVAPAKEKGVIACEKP